METFKFLASYATKLFWMVVYQNVSLMIVGFAVFNCSKIFSGKKTSDSGTKSKNTRAANRKKIGNNPMPPAELPATAEHKPMVPSAAPIVNNEAEKKLSDDKSDEKDPKRKSKKMKDETEKKEEGKLGEGATDSSSTGGTGEEDQYKGLEEAVRIEMSDDDHTITKEGSACFDYNNLEDNGKPVNEANEPKKVSKMRQKKKKNKTKTKASIDTAEQNADGEKKPDISKEIIESVECPIPMTKKEEEMNNKNKGASLGLNAPKKSKTNVTEEQPAVLKTQAETHEEAAVH